ncbi:MAG: hypothetical protein ACTSPB_20130, partial [Candidatus Thorarchaeota archaeon]
MAREDEHLIGAYFGKDRIARLDELAHNLWKAGLIPKSNRSELIRFCVEFMQGYFEGLAENIEGVKIVKDFLVVENILQEDSLEALATVSTKMLTTQVIASVGGQLANE